MPHHATGVTGVDNKHATQGSAHYEMVNFAPDLPEEPTKGVHATNKNNIQLIKIKFHLKDITMSNI
jgi:hypothetical protein